MMEWAEECQGTIRGFVMACGLWFGPGGVPTLEGLHQTLYSSSLSCKILLLLVLHVGFGSAQQSLLPTPPPVYLYRVGIREGAH